jgi:hypothetical protein
MHALPRASFSVSANPSGTTASSLRRAFAALHRFLNGIVVCGAAAQFYTVGLVMFASAGTGSHRTLGSLLIVVGLLSAVAAFVAGSSYTRPWPALGLFGLLMLQPALAFGLRRVAPTLAALHAVNGLLIVGLSLHIAFRRRAGT